MRSDFIQIYEREVGKDRGRERERQMDELVKRRKMGKERDREGWMGKERGDGRGSE